MNYEDVESRYSAIVNEPKRLAKQTRGGESLGVAMRHDVTGPACSPQNRQTITTLN
jgi:hypothetical protein